MPFFVTPGVVRLVFLLLASLTILYMLWSRIISVRATIFKAILVFSAFIPFFAGAFYVTANSIPIPTERHLTAYQKIFLTKELKKSAPLIEKTTVGAMYGDTESIQYASEFMKVLDQAGLLNHSFQKPTKDGNYFPIFLNNNSTKIHGILIDVPDKTKIPETAKIFQKILLEAGLKSEYASDLNVPREFQLVIDKAP